MIVTKKALPRRTFLRGVGTVVALPMLDAMVPALKTSAPAAPPRLGFFHTPNGMAMADWKPKTTGVLEFSKTLQSLEPYRKHVTVLSGLNHYAAVGEGGGPHTRDQAAWLTGVTAVATEGADVKLATTADQYAARVLGKDTVLDSLELSLRSSSRSGTCEYGYSCLYQLLSWRSPTEVNPPESNPRTVFDRLFGEETSREERAARISTDKSILDAVTRQIRKLERKLGASDRTTVSSYLETVREVERRIQKAEKQNSNSEFTGTRPDGIPQSWPEHRQLLYDMLVLAYQGDLTRVATFDCADAGNGGYSHIGVSEQHHEMSHHQHNPDKIAKCGQIDTYNMSEFAKFIDTLAKTQDGDGTLLDHSIMLYGSSMSDGDLHSPLDLPVVLVGGGNGTLKGNQHIAWPEAKKTPMTNLYVTLLDKVGVQVEKIGDSTGDLVEL